MIFEKFTQIIENYFQFSKICPQNFLNSFANYFQIFKIIFKFILLGNLVTGNL